MTLPHVTIEAIHDAILAAVQHHWADQDNQLQTVAEYDPFDAKPVNSPAVLLSVDSMNRNAANDDGTERIAVTLDLALVCVLSTQTPRVQTQIRQFATDIITLIEQSGGKRWGLGAVGGAPDNISAQPAMYSPDKSGFESWAVTWSQIFFIYSEQSEPMPLPTRVFVGVLPDVGVEHLLDYHEVTE